MTVEEMQTELDAMLDPLDIPGAWTQREKDAYETRRRVLAARIADARRASEALAEVVRELVPLVAWRDFLQSLRARLIVEFNACPARPETRAEEYHRLGLDISLRCIESGFDFANETYPPDLPLFSAMLAAGYRAPAHAAWNVWLGGFGPLPSIERRIAGFMATRDLAERHLARALRDDASRPASESQPADDAPVSV